MDNRNATPQGDLPRVAAQILAYLHEYGPASTADLSKVVRPRRDVVSWAFWLRDGGLIARSPAGIWNLADASAVPGTDPGVMVLAWLQMVGPASADDLATALGLHRSAVMDALAHLFANGHGCVTRGDRYADGTTVWAAIPGRTCGYVDLGAAS